MQKILITGAAGFVAGYFTEYLEENNLEYDILGLDILEEHRCSYTQYKYKKINLRDKDLIKEVIENFTPDYILHLASVSSVSQSWNYPVESFVNNTNIFLNIIESIRELNLPTRVLSVGSSEEYGNYPADKMPLKEDYELKPCNPYSVARVSQEMLSKLYADNYGLNIIMTRSFNHIGPRQNDKFVIPSFVKQLLNAKNTGNMRIDVGNIEIVRDFLDVRDVVDAYYKILTKGRIGEIYNVCSGNGIKLKEIINIVAKQLNITPEICIDKSRIRPADNLTIIGDNTKLKSELNWQPKYNLNQTLKDMLSYQGEYMGKKINILFDALTLAENDEKTGNRSGIWFTVYNILKEFAKNENVNIYIYCSKKKFAAKLTKTLNKYFSDNNFNKLYIDSLGPLEYEHSKLTCAYKAKKKFSTKLKLFFVSALKKALNKNVNYEKLTKDIDVYFSPAYHIPDEIKNIKSIKKYTLLYDIIPILFPNYFSDKDMDKYWFTPVWKQLNNNDYYFTISEHTKKDFVEHFPQMDADKVTPVLLACSENFKPEKEKTKASLEKYNLPTDKKYIFSLCTLEPRKNLIRAVKCFIEFVNKNNINDMVYILGGGSWDGFIEKMEKEIPDFEKYKHLILRAGYIDDEDLAPLYSGAEWFVYTSEYEGFGLPPLEAMSCGCPVITSNNSSLPEVVGDCGIMIDYDSDEQHINAYETYYYNYNMRKENAEKGLKRAKEFSWKKCADTMIKKFYETI